jgi:hypothetical protein
MWWLVKPACKFKKKRKMIPAYNMIRSIGVGISRNYCQTNNLWILPIEI